MGWMIGNGRRIADLRSLVGAVSAVCLLAGAPGPATAAQATSAAQAVEQVMPLPVKSPFAEQKRAADLAAFKAKYGTPALEYLESLKGKKNFIAPSEIDPRFTMALYVNASGSGKTAQRMWVLQRDEIGGAWSVGLWDKKHWSRKGLPAGMEPPYSWLVSTGRKYRGDKRSGPTPTGVFAIDERRYRLARGYSSPGMINVVYIDLHYSGGRRSGVAFHGTTYGRYRRLGSIDSHGCIRMTKANAITVLDRLQGRDGVLSDDMRWGDVPRFWKRERGGNRYGYTRSGRPWPADAPTVVAANTHDGVESDATPFPRVLTKEGYRALTVIFRD